MKSVQTQSTRYTENIKRLETYLMKEERVRRKLSSEQWSHVGGKGWRLCNFSGMVFLVAAVLGVILYALMSVRYMDYYTLEGTTGPMWDTGFICFLIFFLITFFGIGLTFLVRRRAKAMAWMLAGNGVVCGGLLVWIAVSVFSIYGFLQDAGMLFFMTLYLLSAACGMGIYLAGLAWIFGCKRGAFWGSALCSAVLLIGLAAQMSQADTFEGQNAVGYNVVLTAFLVGLTVSFFVQWRIQQQDERDRCEMIEYTLQRLAHQKEREGLLTEDDYSQLIEDFFMELELKQESAKKRRG